jgi:hypothetical protein
MYPSISVFESESDRKYKNKYNISDMRPYLIRLHPKLVWIALAVFSGTNAPSSDANNEVEAERLTPAIWTQQQQIQGVGGLGVGSWHRVEGVCNGPCLPWFF